MEGEGRKNREKDTKLERDGPRNNLGEEWEVNSKYIVLNSQKN